MIGDPPPPPWHRVAKFFEKYNWLDKFLARASRALLYDWSTW